MSCRHGAWPASKDALLDDLYSLLEEVTSEGQQSSWTPNQLNRFGQLIANDPGGVHLFSRLCFRQRSLPRMWIDVFQFFAAVFSLDVLALQHLAETYLDGVLLMISRYFTVHLEVPASMLVLATFSRNFC